jgi:hypothetical protein
VPVVAGILRPAQEDVRHGLHQPLSRHHALSLIGIDATPRERRQHRWLRLLELQQKHVVVGGGEQPDGAERTDAADADHLERQIGQPVARQQRRSLLGQSRCVGGEGGARGIRVGVVVATHQRNHQRRMRADAPRPGTAFQQLRIASPRRSQHLLQAPGLTLAQAVVLNAADQPGDIDARPPCIQRIQRRQRRHMLPIGRDRRAGQGTTGLRRQAPAAPVHREAGRQALQVPLERRGQRLVEIVDIEHRRTLGGGEGAEIGQMAIAARLHDQPADRRDSQVLGHDCGGAAEEGEGRLAHPLVAQRQQAGDAMAAGLDQRSHRVAPGGRGYPFSLRAARHLLAQLLAGQPTLDDRRRSFHCGMVRCHLGPVRRETSRSLRSGRGTGDGVK